MKRSRMRAYNSRRKGSAFPKVRNKPYCRWICENACLLAGRLTTVRFTANDLSNAGAFFHVCWGPIDPAHVGEHRSQGAPDFGMVVPLCRAAHQFYDEQRPMWLEATGYTNRRMASAASGYALKYSERGG